MNENFLVFDVEVIPKSTYSFSATPWCVANTPDVLSAFHSQWDKPKHLTFRNEHPSIELFKNFLKSTSIWVGQNIKYDIHILRKVIPDIYELMVKTPIVWDVQLAEYLLTQQRVKFASLEKLGKHYNCSIPKQTDIEKYWDLGKEPPLQLTIDRCNSDVILTKEIFEKQIKKIPPEHMRLFIIHMQSLAATCVMEYNGVYYNIDKADKQQEKLEKEARLIEQNIIVNYFESLFRKESNPNSNDQLSLYLFGGKYKYIGKEPIGRYKTGKRKGQTKYRNVEKILHINSKLEHAIGVTSTNNIKEETKKKGIYKVNDKVLNKVLKILNVTVPARLAVVPWGGIGGMIKGIIELRRLQKLIKTYYEGNKEHLWMYGSSGFFHQNIHHTQTDTGRLSQSKPNLQNIPKNG